MFYFAELDIMLHVSGKCIRILRRWFFLISHVSVHHFQRTPPMQLPMISTVAFYNHIKHAQVEINIYKTTRNNLLFLFISSVMFSLKYCSINSGIIYLKSFQQIELGGKLCNRARTIYLM